MVASEQEVKDIVARVTADVMRESQSKEATFKVADLTAHVTDIVKGADAAWTITYSTAAATLGEASPRLRGTEVAWSISYSTASAALADRGGLVTKK